MERKMEEKKQNNEMFRCGKLNLHVCHSCYVNIHLHHLFSSHCQIVESHVHSESRNTGANYVCNELYTPSVSLRLNGFDTPTLAEHLL